MEILELLPCCAGLKGVQSMLWVTLMIPAWLIWIAGCTLLIWGVIEYLIWRVGKELQKKRQERE